MDVQWRKIIHVSGKTGEGVPELLEAIVERVPAPKQQVDKRLRALIFDSIFNTYRGSVAYVRVMEGVLKKEIGFGLCPMIWSIMPKT